MSYSAKDLSKERTTMNEPLSVSLVSEPHNYNHPIKSSYPHFDLILGDFALAALLDVSSGKISRNLLGTKYLKNLKDKTFAG